MNLENNEKIVINLDSDGNVFFLLSMAHLLRDKVSDINTVREEIKTARNFYGSVAAFKKYFGRYVKLESCDKELVAA
ncbi:hypothetical protein N9R79_09345 [Vibrio sp.]|nr:hypothetical protein [Vibrio sp.]